MARRTRGYLLGATVAGILQMTTPVAHAEFEATLSGFATLGGAISDQDFTAQRFINDAGTIKRDSLIGAQLDLRLSAAWSFTLQGKIAPADDDDQRWEPALTWVFVSWRPSNDWLLRFGKLRLPLMLYSANSDVGMTFDFTRLPTEVYSLMPATDVVGLAASKTWLDDDNEWTLESYLGQAQTDWRYWVREGVNTGAGLSFPTGRSFLHYDMNIAGLVLARRQGENTYRLGTHLGSVKSEVGFVPRVFPYVSIAPGVGYYDISVVQEPGPNSLEAYQVYLVTLGAEISLAHDVRLIGEFARRRFTNAMTGADADAGYLALLRRLGKWTPYAYVAAIRTQSDSLDFIKTVNANRVPAFIPGAALINASQRMGADLLSPFDQHSLALGASYSLSPTSKLKFEWLHTRTGAFSTFIDTPPGEDSGGRQLNIFSLSYNLVF